MAEQITLTLLTRRARKSAKRQIFVEFSSRYQLLV